MPDEPADDFFGDDDDDNLPAKSDLEIEFDEIDERYKRHDLLDLAASGQVRGLWTAVKRRIRSAAEQDQLDPDQYDTCLERARDVLVELAYAFGEATWSGEDPKPAKKLWSHRRDYQIAAYGKADPTTIDRAQLLEAASTYIANPWMHIPALDWLFLDSLIYAELCAYKEEIADGSALGKPNLQYLQVDRDVDRLSMLRVKNALIAAAIRYLAIPAGIAVLWLYVLRQDQESLIGWAFALSALYVLYICWRVIRSIIRIPQKRREAKAAEGAFDLLGSMISAYRQCAGPVISTPELRRTLHAARDKGVVWDGALYAILDRVCSECPISFQPFGK